MKKQIKYSYCVDENNRLVHISELTKETRHSHQWHCLECGQEMTPNLGEKKSWYFSHKANTACDGESYLHKLAKRKIREKFLSSDSFPITFVRVCNSCSEHEKCPLFQKYHCYTEERTIHRDLKKWKGHILYDSCQEEVKVGEFRPDLKLTNSKKPGREPIFIEINVTHQSEEKKLKSKYRIIETMRIKSEDDIEDIIKRGFVGPNYSEDDIEDYCYYVGVDNCQTFNFSLPTVQGRTFIRRFVLFKGDGVKVYRYVTCDKRNKRIKPDSICELNMKEYEGMDNFDYTLDFSDYGLMYLVQKGMKIRNCILCKFREYRGNFGFGGYICTRSNRFFWNNNTCPDYHIDQEKIDKYPLSELEKIISEVPV